MKISRLLICILLVLTLAFAISSCQDKPIYYTVKFDSNGGSPVQTRAIESGKTLIEPDEPERIGYTFVGWYNEDTAWNFETETVKSNVNLTAKWERISHTVTFNSDGAAAIDSQTVYDGNLVTAPQDPTKADSRFIGWYNGESAWNFSSDTVNADMTLTAKWEPITTYTVIFNSNGGSAVANQYIEEGKKAAEPPAPTKQDYAFAGWYNGESKWDFGTDTVNTNVTLTAKWKVTYTVTFNSNGGSDVAPIEVPIGKKIPEPTVTNNTFKVYGWYIEGTNTKWDFLKDVVTEPITLKAEWTVFGPPMPLE